MKSVLVFFLLSFTFCAEAITLKEINAYVDWVDALKKKDLLKKYFYPNMCRCAGALYGYYYKDQLVYIDSHYGAEAGFSGRQVYLKDSVVYKIRYRQHHADWNAYERDYPGEEEFDESKMTYTDTLYTFWLADEIIMYKSAGKKIVSKNGYDQVLLQRLLACVKIMQQNLETEKEER